MRGCRRKGALVSQFSANRGLPLPLGCGVCETKSEKGAPDTENPSRIGFPVLRGGLRPWSPKGPDQGVGVDPIGDFFSGRILLSGISSDFMRILMTFLGKIHRNPS